MKLPKRKIKQIEAWLKTSIPLLCPFSGDGCGQIRNKICGKTFPKITEKKNHSGLVCPCAVYSINHVIKKAKKMVETGEV